MNRKSDSLSYKAHRLVLRVEVKVDDGMLSWSYFAAGDTYKQSLPLAKMFPHPVFSIQRAERWRKLGFALLIFVLNVGGLIWLQFDLMLVGIAAVLCLAIIGSRVVAWIPGPLEWATFQTQWPEKQIYLFRGGPNCGFDEFVNSLDLAIQSAQLGDD